MSIFKVFDKVCFYQCHKSCLHFLALFLRSWRGTGGRRRYFPSALWDFLILFLKFHFYFFFFCIMLCSPRGFSMASRQAFTRCDSISWWSVLKSMLIWSVDNRRQTQGRLMYIICVYIWETSRYRLYQIKSDDQYIYYLAIKKKVFLVGSRTRSR